MIWDKEKGFVEFKTAYRSFRNSLGLSEVDYRSRLELAPYITRIFQFLNKEMVLLGDKATIKDKLEKIFKIFEEGSDKIVDEKALDMAKDLELTDKTVNDEVKYVQDRFVFCWTNIMSTLCERLRIQYFDLLHPRPSDGECPCHCGKGQTQKDWEKWTSGIWPEDEEANRYAGGLSGQASWRPSANTSECLCNGRRK